jgi:uncharacterized protein (DUF58 family)
MNPRYRESLQAGELDGSRYAISVPESALTGITGQQVGRRAGSSVDFQDYREYEPGDDLRTIDWNVYGRTDRLTIKLFREEVTPHLDLVLDCSQSMDLEGSGKAEGSLQTAAILASAAGNARCTQAVWMAGEGFRRAQNDSLRASAWDGIDYTGKRTVEEAFAIMPPRFRRLGIRVLISDLFWIGNPVNTVRRLSDGAAAVYVIQLLAREDVEPPEHGNIHLIDSETGEAIEMFVDAMVEQNYRDALRTHQESWHDACRRSGARFIPIVADDLEGAMTQLEENHLLVPA